jgi:outer membrane protein
MKKTISIITLSVLLAVPATSHAVLGLFGAEGAIGWGQHAPSGNIAFKGESIDLKNNLGFDQESGLTARLKIDMPAVIPNIYLMYQPMEFEGTGSKSTSFQFGDLTFGASAALSSKLTVNQTDIALYYGIPGLKLATAGVLDAELGLNLRLIDLKAQITSVPAGSETLDLLIPPPMVYCAILVDFPFVPLAFDTEARILPYGDNHIYSLIGRLKYNLPLPMPVLKIFVAAGYRYDDIAFKDIEDSEGGITFSGPFLEAGFKF